MPGARRRCHWATWRPRDGSAIRAAIRASSAPTRTDTSASASFTRVRCEASASARRPVSRVLSRGRNHGDGHPSTVDGCPSPLAADPRAGRRTPSAASLRTPRRPSYLALHQVELARFTRPRRPKPTCRFVTVALVLASRRTGVTRYPASRSSDFPRAIPGLPDAARDRPAVSLTASILPHRAGHRPWARGPSGAPGTARRNAPRPRDHRWASHGPPRESRCAHSGTA